MHQRYSSASFSVFIVNIDFFTVFADTEYQYWPPCMWCFLHRTHSLQHCNIFWIFDKEPKWWEMTCRPVSWLVALEWLSCSNQEAWWWVIFSSVISQHEACCLANQKAWSMLPHGPSSQWESPPDWKFQYEGKYWSIWECVNTHWNAQYRYRYPYWYSYIRRMQSWKTDKRHCTCFFWGLVQL